MLNEAFDIKSATRWTHIISSVEGKNIAKKNKYHNQIIGKRCWCVFPEDQIPPYYIATILIEAFGNVSTPRYYHTTPVLKIEKDSAGGITLETQNSIYKFMPIGDDDNTAQMVF